MKNAIGLLLVTSFVMLSITSWEKPIIKTRVNRVNGTVWKGSFARNGRTLHGRCTIHDQAGNLLEESEYNHGACVFKRRYETDGTLQLEIKEGKNYQLVQTFPVVKGNPQQRNEP